MQLDRIPPAPRRGSRVRGLGLCDVLRVELDAAQIPGLIDELEELRGPLQEARDAAHERVQALGDPSVGTARTDLLRDAEEDLSARTYALRVHAALRAQLAPSDAARPLALVGPASTVSTVVAGATRHAVDVLSDLVRDAPRADEEAHVRFKTAVPAAAAWIETYLDCQQVEWFSFDPAWDPVA